jgi:hypothetical protein
MALLAIGPIVGEMLVHDGSLAGRIAGAAIAVLCWIPWIAVVIHMIRTGDEFAFRVHLVALAFAFLGIMMTLAALDWLTRAEFIAPIPLAFIWPVGLVLWFAGIMGASRYYQREA